MIRNEFGTQKSVFANQDDSIFSAVPITLDSAVYTLETETVNGRTIAKAGSVVKEGNVVRGILPEAYDITDGPIAARVALEGYAYVSRLTPNALASAAALPKIVLMPYKATIITLDGVRGQVMILKLEGAKFATTAAINNFTVSGATASSIAVAPDGNTAELAFAGPAAAVSITAIHADAFSGASGTVLKGLPIVTPLVAGPKNTVTVTAGENGTAVSDKATAAEGEIVEITPTAAATYEVDTVKVGETTITAVGGEYKFVMPNHPVAVTVTFKLA